MRAYHLLSAEFALSNLALARMRVSRFNDLNDPFELLAANVGERELRRAIRSWKSDFHEHRGLLCFSLSWENPVLWSHYADKHRGICLGFDLNDDIVQPVTYADSRVPVRFKENDPQLGLSEEFVRDLLRTKYRHWEYEEEVRIYVGLDQKTLENGSYFVPFSRDIVLREVILGANCEIPHKLVRERVAKAYDGVAVKKARLAFKWFKVVADERYRNQVA